MTGVRVSTCSSTAFFLLPLLRLQRLRGFRHRRREEPLRGGSRGHQPSGPPEPAWPLTAHQRLGTEVPRTVPEARAPGGCPASPLSWRSSVPGGRRAAQAPHHGCDARRLPTPLRRSAVRAEASNAAVAPASVLRSPGRGQPWPIARGWLQKVGAIVNLLSVQPLKNLHAQSPRGASLCSPLWDGHLIPAWSSSP